MFGQKKRMKELVTSFMMCLLCVSAWIALAHQTKKDAMPMNKKIENGEIPIIKDKNMEDKWIMRCEH